MSGGLFSILFPIGVFQFSMSTQFRELVTRLCIRLFSYAPHTRKQDEKKKSMALGGNV
jgi:hypothetical protein